MVVFFRAKFRDASGLPKKSKVVIAGLPKGEVTGLEVEGRYAKVTFKIDKEIKVWSSAVVIKKATSLLWLNRSSAIGHYLRVSGRT